MEIHALEEVDKPVAELQEREQAALLAYENVVGVGVGRKIRDGHDTGEPCLTVFVTQKLPLEALSEGARIPTSVRHCKTDVVELGQVFAGDGVISRLSESAVPDRVVQERVRVEPPSPIPNEPLRHRARPARGGCSVGHYNVMGGTIAAGVIDRSAHPGIPLRYYILSNNHVLADANAARIGDPILQPSAADGGRHPQDSIGRLARFVPLRFDGEQNLVDAAVAEVDFPDLDRSIAWLGFPREFCPRVRIGQLLRKTGRTTCFTSGIVQTVNTTIDVNYSGRVARFARQIVTSCMSAPGDSGSLAMDAQERPVGLVFANSERATILNPIGFVESLLQIRVGF
ncbi:MAG: trypsin-like peptidase domain-containing protein [Myxococcota bacterium]